MCRSHSPLPVSICIATCGTDLLYFFVHQSGQETSCQRTSGRPSLPLLHYTLSLNTVSLSRTCHVNYSWSVAVFCRNSIVLKRILPQFRLVLVRLVYGLCLESYRNSCLTVLQRGRISTEMNTVLRVVVDQIRI